VWPAPPIIEFHIITNFLRNTHGDLSLWDVTVEVVLTQKMKALWSIEMVKLLTWQHSVTSQRTWIISNRNWRIWNLTQVFSCLHILTLWIDGCYMKSDWLYVTELLACIWEVSGFESWPQISYHEGFIFFHHTHQTNAKVVC